MCQSAAFRFIKIPQDLTTLQNRLAGSFIFDHFVKPGAFFIS
jgi:hypothetical protein